MGAWQGDHEPQVRAGCDILDFDHDWTEHHRKEGILILSSGLTIHNLRNLESFVPETASLPIRQFNDAVNSAISVSDVSVLPNCRQCIYDLSNA